MGQVGLVRYGTISEIAKFQIAAGLDLARGQRVVVRTHRGVEIGELLQLLPQLAANRHEAEESESTILRGATADDECAAEKLAAECGAEFSAWQRRIETWNLQLELIDLERSLDRSKLVLYVLNDRGAECTKLALQAAAEGLGTIEVQPVGREGLMPQSGGGCGSGGCGSGHRDSEGGSGGCCH